MDRVIINEDGGKQSNIGFSIGDYLCKALPRIAQVEYDGAKKYGSDNWQKISVKDNLEHAVRHIVMYMNSDGEDDDHLAHAMCRIGMAIGKEEVERVLK